MATNRRIEIDVVLNTEQVDQGFQEIEEGGKDLGKTFTGVGETFTGVSGAISSMGDEATQKLGAVGATAQGAIGSIMSLGDSARTTGLSFGSLIGPLGLVGIAVFEVAKAWRDYQDEINGVNIRHDAYIASVSELTSALEELATYQVILNNSEVERLQNLSMTAKLDIEAAQETRERNALIDKRIFRLDKEIKKAKERLKTNQAILKGQNKTIASSRMLEQAALAMAQAQAEIESKERTRLRLSEKLARKEREAIELGRTGAENFAKFEAEKERLLKRSPKLRGEQLNAEAKLLEDAALEQLKLQEQTEKNLTTIAIIESNRRLREIRAQETLSREIKAQAEKAEQKRLMLELAQIQKNAQIKAQQEEAKRRALAAAYRAKRIAKERQTEAELAQIRSLEIDRLRIIGLDQENILELQYKQELKLAKDNNNKKIIAAKRYNNALTQLTIDRRKRDEAEQQAKDQAEQESLRVRQERIKAFMFDTQEFNAQQIKDQTQREIALLDLRYKKEIELNAHTQQEITELQRRQSIERQKIVNQSLDAQIARVGEFANQYGAGLVEAAYSSLLFGESFEKSVGNILVSLGQQAAVQSLMETAKGTAALILNPAAASNHFAAAGLFAGAAATAGLAGKSLGGGTTSASGGAVSSTSPTGTPQTANTPQREQADTSQMVFNINFGGAVIYDTQRAAEQALADRITTLQNTRRRGAPRRGAM